MITLLSTSDTDLLSAQAATHTEDVHYQYANPNLLTEQTLAQLVDTTDVCGAPVGRQTGLGVGA